MITSKTAKTTTKTVTTTTETVKTVYKSPAFIKPTKKNIRKHGKSSSKAQPLPINPSRPSTQTAQTGANYARNYHNSRPATYFMETLSSEPFCILAERTGEWLGFHVQPGMYFGYDGNAFYVARPHDANVKERVYNDVSLYEFTGMPVYRISESGEWFCQSENTPITRALYEITLRRLSEGTFPVWNRRETEKIPFQASRPRY